MRNYFILDGVDSREFGVYISGQGTFSAPQKAYQFYNIPGRNGSLLGNEHRLENINVSYEAFIYSDFDNNMAAFRSFLLSLNGYKRLTDSYHPDEFRMAVYTGPFEPKVERTNDCGSFTITFSCKPERWLFSGDTQYSPQSGTMSGNPIYADMGDVDTSSLSLSIGVPYGNGSETYKKTGFNPAGSANIRVNDTIVWNKGGWQNPWIIEANFSLETGGTITKCCEFLPTTGWSKKSGYGSLYEVAFTPTGTIIACSFLPFKTGSSYTVGNCYYDSTNHKFIVAAPATITTLSAFNSYLAQFKNISVVETCSISQTWSSTVELPAGFGIMAATLGRRFSISDPSQDSTEATLTATVTGSDTIVNPTPFASRPLIRLYSNGTVSINGISITVVNSTSYVDIDCDIMDCYEGSTNRNADVTFSTYDFPVLVPGENTFTIVSGIGGIVVTPRWWQV